LAGLVFAVAVQIRSHKPVIDYSDGGVIFLF
jgi:hypothetical protein